MASNTVPIFAPDGTLGDVPYEQMHAALAAGGKPGVTIKSPDGKLGVVPADRSLEAVHAGGQIVPLKDQETQHPGFWQSLYENTPLKGVVDKASELMQDPDKIQSLPYDLVAGLVNSQANEMKKGAALRAQGHTAEGLAHSAMGRLPVVGPILAQGAENVGTALGQGNYRGAAGAVLGTAGTLLAPKIAEEAGPAAKTVAESRPGQSVGVVAKAVSKLPVIDKVVKAGKTLGELKDVWSDQPPPTEPDATSPKQNYAGENYGPMDKPKVGGEPDATSENTPNAGEEWFKEPPDATASNKPYAGEERVKPKPNRDATGENKPYAGEKIVENDATPQNKDYAGENWSKKPTSISQVAKPDVDTAAYMQAVKENGGKIDASVSGRALEIKKSWAAQSPKAQASIPTPATVEPSPSSEAYQEAPTPEGTRVPGENEDLTNLLTKSVEKAKAPEYDDATIAEARKQLTEQGYDPDHIELALKSLTGKASPEPTVAPRARVEQKMGMSVDEQFRNHPAGPQPPFPYEAYEEALAGSDAIKNKLSNLKGVKVPRSADLTPEEIGALMRKFHDQRTRFGY